MTLNCSEDPVPALKHGSDQNQRWETSGQTIATCRRVKVWVLLVLSRASMPWVSEHGGFGAACVSQQFRFSASDHRHLWSHDQLSKAQRKRNFLPMLIYSASCSRSQSCFPPQHFRSEHIKWALISWSVKTPTSKVCLVDLNTWKQWDIFGPTWGQRWALPGPADLRGTPSPLHSYWTVSFPSWQTWHNPRSLPKHNDSAYIYYFETSDHFSGNILSCRSSAAMMWTHLVYIYKHHLTPIGWCRQEQEMVLYANKGPHVDPHPAEVTLYEVSLRPLLYLRFFVSLLFSF